MAEKLEVDMYKMLRLWHAGMTFWIGSDECEALSAEANRLAEHLKVDVDEVYERPELVPLF